MNSTGRILIVDDEAAIREDLGLVLRREGHELFEAADGEQALALIRIKPVDTVLLDIGMPGLNGMEALRQIKMLDRDLPVVMVTADGLIQHAVAALRAGAHDYLVKPFEHADVIRSVHSALAERGLRHTIAQLSERTREAASLRDLMGSSAAITTISADVARVGCSDFTVLIVGETGTGKELVARATHAASRRAAGPFVAVDCGAIPETLFESDLFGHEKGSFTGADRTKPGKFEIASGGTLFLDEVANLPHGCQAKLLRVLQERKVFRVGGTKATDMDVRLIAASNQDLEPGVRHGLLRCDLFYRLNEFVIRIPPLRNRRQDIVFLAKRFLDETNRELGKSLVGFSERAVERLLLHDWPGNVRELRSTIRRAVLLADRLVDEQHLGLPRSPLPPVDGLVVVRSTLADRLPLKQLVRRATMTVERTALVEALMVSGGNKAKAARLLQIDYKTMHVKVREYNIGSGGGMYAQQEEQAR